MKIDNGSISTQSYNLINKALDVGMERSKVILNNIANVNTKGYKRHYVSFEESLNEAKENEKLKTTNERHIQISDSVKGSIEVKTDESGSMKTDGNNVDIDNEAINLAANAFKYNTLISQINSRISMKRNVITGGK